MSSDVTDNLTRSSSWLRGLFMLIFIVIYGIAEFVLGAVVIFQFLFLIFSGAPNDRLQRFGAQISLFVYEVFLYLTFNRDTKPFPFAPWPEAEEAERSARTEAEVSEETLGEEPRIPEEK